MKKLILLFISLWGCVSWCENAANKAAAPPATESSGKMWSVNARAGFMLQNPDDAVISRWEHKPLESYKYGVGGSIYFPPRWAQFKFLGGAEFQYITAKEELSGAYNATIDVTIMQFVPSFGFEYRPFWAQGLAGNITIGVPLWSQKSSQLDAEGFTQDLGTESAHNQRNILGPPLLVGFNFYYDFGSFRPYVTWESDSAFTLGGAYVF